MTEDSRVTVVCTLCQADGIKQTAAAYCSYCKEYMCESCCGYHAKFKAARHEVLTGEDMINETKETPSATVSHVSCSEHMDHNLVVYCPDHDAVCCEMCVKVHHRKCEVIPLAEAAAGIIPSQECTDTVNKIQSLTAELQTEKDNIDADIGEIGTDKETFTRDVNAMKSRLYKIIDEHEASMLADMETTADNEARTLNNNTETCGGIIDTLNTDRHGLNSAIRDEDEIKVFIEIKRVSKQCDQYESLLSEITHESTRSKFQFSPNEKLSTFLDGLDTIGSIDLQSAQSVTDKFDNMKEEGLTSSHKEDSERRVRFDDGGRIKAVGNNITNYMSTLQHFKGKKAFHIGDYVVRGQDDVERCDITGCDFLSDGRLLLADHNNQLVKVLDKDFTSAASILILSSEPWDTAILDNDMAAVTLPEERKIQFLHTKQGLEPGDCVSTKRKYWGIVKSMVETNMLIVSCTSIDGDPQIHITDMTGAVRRRIEHDSTGKPIFDSPYHLTHTGKRLCVSDSGKESIVTLTVDGHVKHIYTDGSLVGLNGIAIDQQGNSYVCGNVSNNVQQIGATGEMVKEMVTARDGIRHPQAVCVNGATGHMVISMYNTDTIKVFQLR